MKGSDRIDQLINAIEGTYISRRPISQQLAQEAARFLPGGNTRSVLHSTPFPFRISQASGSELVDVDGNRYVDLLGNYSAGLFGNNPSYVKQAVQHVLEVGWGFGAVNKPEIELAKLISERFPSIKQVRFTNSGTEANLMAISAARLFTRRKSILVFEGAYHGAVLSFNGAGRKISCPYEWIICEYNSLDSVAKTFQDRGPEIAAVLVEPMLGVGGCIRADRALLRGISKLCASNGSLLIFDEVMTSRLSLGGAQALLDVSPHITTLGKYLAGGMTFGAFGGGREIMTNFDVTRGDGVPHGGTFNNNMMSMSAGVAALRYGLTQGGLETLNEKGERLRRRLNDIFTSASVGMCATGWGSIMSIHATFGPVVSYSDLSNVDMRVSNALFMFLANEGFYIAPRGYIALSLEVSDAQVNDFLSAVRRFATLIAEKGD